METVERLITFIASFLAFSILALPNGMAEPLPTSISQGNIQDYVGALNDGRTYTLDGNIDLTGLANTIGGLDSYLGNLSAVFDGSSGSIIGLTKPLFNSISQQGEVKDVSLATAAVGFQATSENTGVLAKTSEGTITNVSASGTIDADRISNIGGLVGEVVGGLIDNSTSTVTIQNGLDNIGGLVGSVEVAPTLSASNTVMVMGANGVTVTTQDGTTQTSVTISNSSATGSVISGENNVGGLVGSVSVTPNVTTDNTVNSDSANASSITTGSITLQSTVTISDATTQVTIESSGSNIGGVVGSISAAPSNTSTNTVTASGENNASSVYTGTVTTEASVVVSGSDVQVTVASGVNNIGGVVGSISATPSNNTTNTVTASGENNASTVSTGSVTTEASVTISNTIVQVTVAPAVDALRDNIGGVVGNVTLMPSNATSNDVTSTADNNASSITTGNVTTQSTVTISGVAPTTQVTISSSGDNHGGVIGNIDVIPSDSTTSNVTLSGTNNASTVTSGSVSVPGEVSVTNADVDGEILGGYRVGGIIGRLRLELGGSTLVQGSNTNGTEVSGEGKVGGIIGEVDAEQASFGVETSEVSGDVSGTDDYVGGLIGYIELLDADVTISETNVFGDVSGATTIGGLIGFNFLDFASSVTIEDSNAYGDVSGDGFRIGGLIGYSEILDSNVVISGSTTTGSILGASSTGGLIGEIYMEYGSSLLIEDSHTSGTVESFDGIIESFEDDAGGLIGSLYLDGSEVSISNVSTAGEIQGDDNIGGLIGMLFQYGSAVEISDASVTGVVTGDQDIGGLIGDAEVRTRSDENSQLIIENSSSTGVAVSGEDSVGGLLGEVTIETTDSDGPAGSVQISNSYSESQIIGENSYIGGLVGHVTDNSNIDYSMGEISISNSFSTGNVEGSNSVGGLLGYGWYVEIAESYAHGDVSLSSAYLNCDPAVYFCPDIEYFGGLIGYVYNVIVERSYASGDVYGGIADYVGGLIGEVETGFAFVNQVSASHATGNVDGNNYVGGLIGSLSEYSLIQNSYASGDVVALGYAVGGLIGSALESTTVGATLAYGDVQGDHIVGGLVGELEGTVSFSAALGNVDGDNYVGGLVGVQQTGSQINMAAAFGDVNLNSDCSEGPYTDSHCEFIGGLVGFANTASSISTAYATGDVRGHVSVGGLVGEAYGSIEISWAGGTVLSSGGLGESLVGFCATEPRYCETIDENEASTNLPPQELPAPIPDALVLVEVLNFTVAEPELGFSLDECINSGLPYLVLLLDSYPNSCNNNDDDNGDDTGDNDSDSPRKFRLKIPALTKTVIAESLSTRNFTPAEAAISTTCTFKLRTTDSSVNDSPLNLVTAPAAKFLSRVVLKTIDSLQLKIDGFTGKSYGVWINDPNCGQVKIGVATSKDGLNEVVLDPIAFEKYGDYVLSFVLEGADSQPLDNWLPEFQILLQVNDDGSDEFFRFMID